jgi:hypothetical protein
MSGSQARIVCYHFLTVARYRVAVSSVPTLKLGSWLSSEHELNELYLPISQNSRNFQNTCIDFPISRQGETCSHASAK